MSEMSLHRIVTGKRPCLALVFLTLLFLAGCWDAESQLELRSDGSGQMTVFTRIKQGDSGCRNKDIPQSPVEHEGDKLKFTPNLKALRYFMDSHCVVEEKSSFAGLYELTSEYLKVRLERLDPSASGRRIRIRQTFPYSAKGFKEQFKGHTLTAFLSGPGEIEQASPVKIDSQVFTPQISGKTARWDIPMDKMNENVTLEVVFVGESSAVNASSFLSSKDYPSLAALKEKAEQGDTTAQFKLGYGYANGAGVAPDVEAAARWYLKSAARGEAGAQNNLGTLYEEGRGVSKDPKEALRWYRLAVEQGNAYAQYNLGRFYEQGIEVAQNQDEAIKWYRLAAAQGHSGSKSKLEELKVSK